MAENKAVILRISTIMMRAPLRPKSKLHFDDFIPDRRRLIFQSSAAGGVL